MKLEYYYSQICGSTTLERIKEVSDGLKELFNTYFICSTLIDQDSALPPSSLPGGSNDGRDRLKGFDKFLHETSQSLSDLEKYLDELVFPCNCDFNILNWWRVHTMRYPILSMMARDVLGTPMSTVSQESAFNAGGRMLDSSRSSLTPDKRQALIHTQDWLLIQSDGAYIIVLLFTQSFLIPYIYLLTIWYFHKCNRPESIFKPLCSTRFCRNKLICPRYNIDLGLK
ncbi:zinc finger BED domain-containing protein RICESLEEPER 1-like isoform X2 [Hibiscus syriacus]|uniref:zinc finger BED domain-containing protein RICESLEEPER 1-like isoform X2 n=1 Tax=Hibiscus syriacus TaxID=106335 RepID=UPI0019232EE2|nr:zinc finger BED domain-containing protein RICESLEEPER 1-like isoform X2 [Hibiscus syriacus]